MMNQMGACRKSISEPSAPGLAARLNPARSAIRGTICGVRIEEIEEPRMREIRYLDKLVDEVAKGKAMEKVLRG
jgi:hypothetical protein